jgi:hypothetical protein
MNQLKEHKAGWAVWKGSRFHTMPDHIHFFAMNDIKSLCERSSLEERYVKTTKFVSKEDLLSIYHPCKNCIKHLETYEKFGCRLNEITAISQSIKDDRLQKLQFPPKHSSQVVFPDKVLVPVGCPADGCDEKGMAYEDPKSRIHKEHFCIGHHPKTKMGVIAA